MAWLTPKTFSFKEKLTSADMNTYLRDNTAWLGAVKPRCSAVRNTNLSIADGAATAITLPNTEDFDVGNMHDPSSSSERIVVPSGGAGLYLVNAMVSWTTNSSGRRIVTLRLNGSPISGVGDTRAPDSAGSTVMSFAHMLQLADGDYIDMTGQQTSGGALNVTGARLQACWLATVA